MEKGQIIIICLLAVILIGVVAILINMYSDKGSSEEIIKNINQQIQNSNLSLVEKTNCENLAKEIMSDMQDANYCSKDSDCIAIGAGFPFECYVLINKDSNYKQTGDKVREFYTKCLSNQGPSSCLAPPSQDKLECKSGKCVLKSISSSSCTSNSQCSSGYICIRHIEGNTNLYGGVGGTPENPGVCVERLDNPSGQPCTDSDGGKDIYVKGEVNRPCPTDPVGACLNPGDNCADNSTLVETFCNSAGNLEQQNFNCPNGCVNEACKRSSGG